ncbi:SAM-dependent methyltransferase [Streptosporangiaceae bacterium NEAU-GS5]|nr:SAM-dependent methyltransferase [Streptosporangiaceae bacterium NEAU-GS5]
MTWRAATTLALYGEQGFYLQERPDRHFRTSVHASVVFAEAVTDLLRQVDAALGHPGTLDFVDMGAGDGLLAARVREAAPRRVRVTAVDLAARPDGLDPAVAWASVMPDGVTGLVLANEWLDNVPLDVIEQTPDGPLTLLVDASTGEERAGPRPCAEDLEWAARWWPLRSCGERAEIGRPRDEAWQSVLVRLSRGLAVAVDYAHSAGDRPQVGTLTGYRDGTRVPAIPDGGCDITAHVALDACAAAGEQAGAGETALSTQREALRALGVTGARPPLDLAREDPPGYLRALSRASQEAELIDPAGLGGFGWLTQWKR